ncbi:hypothetical protein H6G97_45070 [Nostoc flagelliforme FACHB-838]|uniref:Methyl-accepting chemotaxis protein n=1 Tax=Nostoc flagelliforme FACHB-838 TaxID=2692904 RepID=A0ABR8E3K8_9NOSO|nr:hypothetical protein [Nostoc flagelliforme]MBD2536110.1 hypothetical protein [Nostoc flagelliforme FACHB-838]
MTATITRPKPKKAATKPQSPYKRLHVIIPIEDLLWASQQKPSITQLWQECWTADPYGSRWMPLTSALGYSTFISAKKILSESGLFIFKPDKSIQDSRETVVWMVKNLHGSRMKEFWEKANSLNQPHAPLGGASPQTVQGVSEKEEELPAVTECTTLALVDAVQGESASLLAENQDCGVEPRDCHEGTGSAAPPAQIEKSSTSAIADQKIEPSCPSAELMTENSVSGVEMKADHEGEGSAVLVTEKWSHEAIVARANARPVRREKLNRAANSGENPGFDFLQECWNDDPALQIVIKKLLVKFPQWGIAVVDGVLVKWDE